MLILGPLSWFSFILYTGYNRISSITYIICFSLRNPMEWDLTVDCYKQQEKICRIYFCPIRWAVSVGGTAAFVEKESIRAGTEFLVFFVLTQSIKHIFGCNCPVLSFHSLPNPVLHLIVTGAPRSFVECGTNRPNDVT